MDKEHILFVHIDICVHVCCTAWAQVHRMRYGELKGCLHLHTFFKKNVLQINCQCDMKRRKKNEERQFKLSTCYK